MKDCYGSPRRTQELAREGQPVGHNRVTRLLAANHLGAKPRGRHRVTTISDHDLEVAKNLLERHFEVEQPDQVWVSIITHLPTAWVSHPEEHKTRAAQGTVHAIEGIPHSPLPNHGESSTR